jgi:predicted dehydrogenase
MVNIGILGYGYWGPNIVRNFNSVEDASVVAICDINPASIAKARKAYPGSLCTSDWKEITSSPSIDAVAIITPVSTHYELAKSALIGGKHIFVEKPFTADTAQAEELIELAEKKKLKIMVDHTFLFTGAVKKIKELIDSDVLGDLLYYDSPG